MAARTAVRKSTATTPAKRPVGRPRKDGTPAGSPRTGAATRRNAATANVKVPTRKLAAKRAPVAKADPMLDLVNDLATQITGGAFDSHLSILVTAMDARLTAHENQRTPRKVAAKRAPAAATSKLPATPVRSNAPKSLKVGAKYAVSNRQLKGYVLQFVGPLAGADVPTARMKVVSAPDSAKVGKTIRVPNSGVRNLPASK